MHFLRAALVAAFLAASLLVAAPVPGVAAATGPPPSTLGQRPSGGFLKADRLAQAEADLGQPIRWYVGMAGRRSANDMRGSVHGQLLARDAVLPRVADRMNLVMTVPLAFGNAKANTAAGQAEIRGLLNETASGRWDDAYRQVARSLVEGGYPDAVIRLGHEFTGGWYPWSAQGNSVAYVAAYRHVHDVLASVSPQFRFEWNAARNSWIRFGPDAYPGDAYVDLVGLDVYYEPWKGDKALTEDYWQRRYQRVLVHHQSFARSRGKQVSYAEWGNGGVDEPEFIRRMHGWFASLPTNGAGSLAYHSYFNVNKAIYNLDNHPKSKAAYLELFGASAGSEPPVVSPIEPDPDPDPGPEPPPHVILPPEGPSLEVPARIVTRRNQPTVIDIDTDAEQVYWAKLSGPGSATWSDKRAEDPVVRFHSTGTYVVVVRAYGDGAVSRARIQVVVSEA